MPIYLTHRPDANANAIYDTLQAYGIAVERIGQPMDAVCEYRGVVAFIDVKGPKGQLTPNQIAFTKRWRGIWAILVSDVDCRWLLGILRARAGRVRT